MSHQCPPGVFSCQVRGRAESAHRLRIPMVAGETDGRVGYIGTSTSWPWKLPGHGVSTNTKL